MASWIALFLLVLAGFALVLYHDAGTIGGFDNAELAALVAGVALLIFIGTPLIGRYRGQIGTAFRDFVIWAAFAFVLVAGYGFRSEIMMVVDRVAGELAPAGTYTTVATGSETGGAVRVRRHSDGHFEIRVDLNRSPVSMIVDTGASTVVLRPADAESAGIDTSGLSYVVPVQTANGSTFAAPVRIGRITIGPISIDDVEALVARPGDLHQSLLGMSFLSRLRSYEFSGDFLTLRS
ncbi:MAG: TIGR02281 family clan AA aspartic protease [Hyphomicrobiaceae bacterium]